MLIEKRKLRRGVIFGLVLAFAGGATSTPLKAQSFLDKLEQAVRGRIDEPAKSADQLPLPKQATHSTTAKQPSKDDIPPVPPPPQPNGANGSAAADSPRSPASSSRIYLGLEAEAAIGGGIGVRVSAVSEDSPAWKAGFQVGDRILAVNGFAISGLPEMASQLAKVSPGDSIKFLVTRSGRNRILTAVVMDAELAGRLRPPASSASAPIAGEPYIGLIVNDLTEAFRRQFGIRAFRGAAVSRIEKGSPADRAGIVAGDAIIEAAGTPIESADAMLRWVQSTKPGQQVELLTYRGGGMRRVQLVIGSQDGPIKSSGKVAAAPATNSDQALWAGGRPQLSGTADLQLTPSSRTKPTAVQETEPDPQLVSELDRLKQENAALRSQLEATERKLQQIQVLLKGQQ